MKERDIHWVHGVCCRQWMMLPGVEGIAISHQDNQPCIRVYLSEAAVSEATHLPASFEGVPIITECTGSFTARPLG